MEEQGSVSEARLQQKRRIIPIADCPLAVVSKRRFGNMECSSTSADELDTVVMDWLDTFNNMPDSLQTEALNALIPHCKQSQIKHLQSIIAPYFQIDFLSFLPKEIALKIIGFLSPSDLVTAARTSRTWHNLTENKWLWMEKCRQYSIKEIFPPNLSRQSNWDLHGLGDMDDPLGNSSTNFKTFYGQNEPSTTTNMASAVNSDPLPSCFERSQWKAIYLRNTRINKNWKSRHPSAVCQLRGHDEHVITCLKLRGDLIVTGSDDCTLRVWSIATAMCTHVLTGHIGGVWALQLSSDGKIAISGSTDRTVRVWDTENGKEIHCLTGHTSTVRCMSLRGNILVTGSRDCLIKIWDVDAGRCVCTLFGHLAAVRCVKFDGEIIVSGAYDHNIHVWDAREGTLLHVLEGHTNRVYSIHFASERNLVVSGSLDTTIKVWNVRTGECIQTLVGHQSLTSGMKLRDNILVSANADSTIKVWNILDGTCVHTFAGPNKHASAVTGLRFLENGFVATSGDDGTVKLWDVKEGTFMCDLVRLPSHGSGGCVWRMKATPTILVCAVGSRNGTEETSIFMLDFDVPYP